MPLELSLMYVSPARSRFDKPPRSRPKLFVLSTIALLADAVDVEVVYPYPQHLPEVKVTLLFLGSGAASGLY